VLHTVRQQDTSGRRRRTDGRSPPGSGLRGDIGAGRFQDCLSRGRRGGVRPSLGSVLRPCHGGSHPPPSHCPAVSQRGSLRGGHASRHIHRRGSHLFGSNPSVGSASGRWAYLFTSSTHPRVCAHRPGRGKDTYGDVNYPTLLARADALASLRVGLVRGLDL
jgi:hypothetical protein